MVSFLLLLVIAPAAFFLLTTAAPVPTTRPTRRPTARPTAALTCQDVLGTSAVGPKKERHTCGARIDWMKSKGQSETDAKNFVACEIPETCGPCKVNGYTCPKAPTPKSTPSPTPTPIVTCESVLGTPAPYKGENYKCGARIDWLKTTEGQSEEDARNFVACEIPATCGPCKAKGYTCPEIKPPTQKPTPPPNSAPGATLKVMSYNTEYIGYPCCGRVNRLQAYGAKIVEVGAAVVGLQECQDGAALKANAPGYSLVPGTGNGNIILYKKSKLRVLDSSKFSIVSDCYAARTISWARFSILGADDAQFLYFNTHLPHNGCDAASRNSHAQIAQQLLSKRDKLSGGQDIPTVVTGDCNPFASSGASEGSFESNLDAGGVSKRYQGTGRYGGFAGLDKIFASDTDWESSNGGDHGTGSSDHPAISVDLTLK